MRFRAITALTTLIISVFTFKSFAAKPSKPLRYCSGVEAFSPSPARPLKFGLELNLLLLIARPIISDSKINPGVLASWHFDSSKNVLTGRLVANLRWANGDPVTSSDVAHSIAFGLANRMIGDSVHVLGAPKGAQLSAPVKGIVLKSSEEFQLYFDAKIQNPKGAVIEALSVNSRPNRVWVGKFDQKRNRFSDSELLSKQSEFRYVHGKLSFVAEGNPVVIELGLKCSGGDFYSSPAFVEEDFSNFTYVGMNPEQSLVGFLNSESAHLKDDLSKKNLIGFVRAALRNSEPYEGYRVASGHFEKGEPGFANSSPNWDFPVDYSMLPKNGLVFELWMHPSERVPIVRLTKELAKSKGIQLTWIGPSDIQNNAPSVAVYFAGSQIRAGRQVWLQTALGWDKFRSNLRRFSKTSAALETIRSLSSATLPVEIKSLQVFERSTFDELSVFPAARYRSSQFSRKNSVLELVPDDRDELTLIRRIER